jgi:hypothetical protein
VKASWYLGWALVLVMLVMLEGSALQDAHPRLVTVAVVLLFPTVR